ncbi:hypothetical protein F5884DRAFT_850550 [Xylogone sp. PMI_703]|nr:hypothetical protein F5884DRAFT_850550 [Xylogone sp. PMI_703]
MTRSTLEVNIETRAAASETLSSFISDLYFDIVIQPNDTLFEQAYVRDFSVDLVDVINGQPFNFTSFRQEVSVLRQQFVDRKLVNQSFVVVPADSEGNTGGVAHTAHLTATQEGFGEAQITTVSVLQIIFNSQLSVQQVESEHFVFLVE